MRILKSIFYGLIAGIAGLAFWYLSPLPMPLTIAALALLAVITISAIISPKRTPQYVFLAVLLAIFGLWLTQTPSNDRNWRTELAHTAYGTVNGDTVTLHNVRDFNWQTEDDYTPNWQTQTYDLNNLQTVDMFLSVWDSPLIAHTLVSFGFTDGRFVTFSVEIRRQQGQLYSPIAGFFRQYDLAMMAATERDIVYLRTNIRKEDVSLYRINLTPAQRRALFVSYVDRANELHQTPRFYNTILANCTTVPYEMVKSFAPSVPLDYRVLISGLLPQYIDELGALLPPNTPLADIEANAHISKKASALSPDPSFSSNIRKD